MNRSQIEYAVNWLEQKQKSLQAVCQLQTELEDDHMRGFRNGIEYANKYYAEEISRLRQLVDGYMTEDVNLNGMEDELHESA